MLLLLERAQRENADGWVAVAIDPDGQPICVTGPFDEPEAALLAGAADERAWRDDHEIETRTLVLPLWRPSE